MKSFLVFLLLGGAVVFAAQVPEVKIEPGHLAKTWKRAIGTNVFDLRPLALASGPVKGGGATNQWRAINAGVFTVTRSGVFAQESNRGKSAVHTVEGARFYFIRNAPPVVIANRQLQDYPFQDFVFITTNKVAFTYKGGQREALVVDYGRVVSAPEWIP